MQDPGGKIIQPEPTPEVAPEVPAQPAGEEAIPVLREVAEPDPMEVGGMEFPGSTVTEPEAPSPSEPAAGEELPPAGEEVVEPPEGVVPQEEEEKPVVEEPAKEEELEPKPEGEGEVAVEPVPFDMEKFKEKMTPEELAHYEGMQGSEEKATDLEKRLTDQGRELAAVETAAKEKSDAHVENIEKTRTDYNAAFAHAKQQQGAWVAEANKLDGQALQADQDGNTKDATALRDEAGTARHNSYLNEQKATGLTNWFNTWEMETVVTHTREQVSSFMDKFPEFKVIEGDIDNACNEVGLNPLAVKQSPKQLLKFAQMLLDAKRGSPEALKIITDGSAKLAKQIAIGKRGAGLPSSGTRTETAPTKVPETNDMPTKGRSKNED